MPGAHAPGETWFYVHGILFTTWLALLFTQASLIGAGNAALHRHLAVSAEFLVTLMPFSAFLATLIAPLCAGGVFEVPVSAPGAPAVAPFADARSWVFSG